jgi:hypothetical protein
MVRKLLFLALALLLATSTAHAAGELSDEDILALAGPRTCEFGQFPDQAPREISIPLIVLDPGIVYEYCFKLPKRKKSDIGSSLSNGYVNLATANRANTSCGTATVYMIRPNRKPLGMKMGSQPRAYAQVDTVQHNMLLRYTPGVWRVLIKGESGFEDKCNRYKVDVTW